MNIFKIPSMLRRLKELEDGRRKDYEKIIDHAQVIEHNDLKNRDPLTMSGIGLWCMDERIDYGKKERGTSNNHSYRIGFLENQVDAIIDSLGMELREEPSKKAKTVLKKKTKKKVKK